MRRTAPAARVQARPWDRTRPSAAGAASRQRSGDGAGAAAARRVDDARRRPRPRTVARSEPVGSPRQPSGATDQRSPAGSRRPARPPRAAEQRAPGRRRRRVAVEQHPGRGAVPQHRRRPVSRVRAQRERDRPAPRTTATPAGRAGVRSTTSPMTAERAERADEQPAQVEAAHVLHRRTAGLHQRAVGGDVADLEHSVAHRSPPGGGSRCGRPRARRRRSRPATSRRARRTGRAPASAASSSATVVPAPHPDGHLGRLVGDDPRRRAAPRAPPGATARRRPTACARPRRRPGRRSAARPRRRSVQSAGRHHTHTPSGICWRSPQREPAGSTFVGVGAAVGVERVAQPGLGVEVVRREQQRHEVALLEPDAVLARQHAAGVDDTPARSRRRRRAPARARRARGRRRRAAGAGCRRRRGTRSSRAGSWRAAIA